MKFHSLLLIVVLAGAFASMFFLTKPDGTPILSLEAMQADISMPDLPRPETASFMDSPDSSSAPGEQAGASKTGTTEYYRWQDAAGIWHFSDTLPPGVSAQLERTSQVNVISFPAARTAGVDKAQESSSTASGQRSGAIQDPLKQAAQVQGQLDAAMDRREQALREL